MNECNVQDFVLLYQEMVNLEADGLAHVIFRNMTMLCLDAMGIDPVELYAYAGEVHAKTNGQGELSSEMVNEVKEEIRRQLDSFKTSSLLASTLK